MPCAVCSVDKSSYKCPACTTPYCSVTCYKQHKTVCIPGEPSTVPAQQSSVSGHNERFDQFLENPRVRELLNYEGVKTQLDLVARILVDASLSGEQTTEGRRMVALKKVRELRKGGRDANAAIEELAVLITQMVQ